MTRDFEAKAAEVRRARCFAVEATSGWGVDERKIEAVVGELAANAYVHARSAFTVSLARHDHGVSVRVFDQDAAIPVLCQPESTDGVGGRGLLIVSRIAVDWGVEPTGRGKIVWADLTTDESG